MNLGWWGERKPRLLTVENKLVVTRGEGVGGWVKWVMGIKESTCDEPWVLCVRVVVCKAQITKFYT